MAKYSQKSKGEHFSLSHIGFPATPAAICAANWYSFFAVLASVVIAFNSIKIVHLSWVIFKRHLIRVFVPLQITYSPEGKSF